MDDLRKAAEMALVALCSANPIGHALEDYEYHNKATEALRQALAQPEQNREAWLDSVCALLRQAHDVLSMSFLPHKREWQSLTDDEIKAIVGQDWGGQPISGYTRSLFDKIDKKLKEKNGGAI